MPLPLPSGTVTGNLYKITGATSGSELAPEVMENAQVILTPNVKNGSFVAWDSTLYKVDQIPVVVGEDGSIGTVRVLANHEDLSISNLQWQAEIRIGPQILTSFWFNAPEDNENVDLASVARVPSVTVHDVTLTMEMIQAAISSMIAGGVGTFPFASITGSPPATTPIRLVGKAPELGPTTGAWQTNDVTVDPYGAEWICAAGGSPGTWWNKNPGYQDQVPNEFQYGATWLTGGPYTLTSTPQTVNVNDASNFPVPSGGAQTPIIIGTGVVEGTPENRVFARYTGVSGNTLTGVTTQDGASHVAADGLQVWYAKSGLKASYLRIPNGIIARSGLDARPHDLVLAAAYDDSGRINRADFDIIFTREAGSYGVCHFALPIKFPKDCYFTDGSNSNLLGFAAGTSGTAAKTNSSTKTPIPTGSIYVYGRLEGRSGSSKNLILKNSGEVSSKIEFQNSSATRLLYTDEAGAEVGNNVELRFAKSSGGYGSIYVSTGNTLIIRSPGSNGIQFNDTANAVSLFRISDAGVASGAAVSLTATANTLALRDANANIVADNHIASTTSTVTSAGTTTLTIADTQTQVFTGSTTHTLKLPTTGIVAGQSYTIINQSSGGSIAVQSSGANSVGSVAVGKIAVFTAKIDTPTAAADWFVLFLNGTSTATTSTTALRDGNANLFSDNFISSSTNVVTAAGTTTLTIDSTRVQVFTGSTTQTVLLPTTSVLAGQIYEIINQSSGVVTVQSSGANTIDTVAAGSGKMYMALAATPTTAAQWRSI